MNKPIKISLLLVISLWLFSCDGYYGRYNDGSSYEEDDDDEIVEELETENEELKSKIAELESILEEIQSLASDGESEASVAGEDYQTVNDALDACYSLFSDIESVANY